MSSTTPDHYATLGLDRRCTEAQIRAAYRLLAKQHHPDVNGGAPAALAQTQALNAAYEILSDPARRRAYDEELSSSIRSAAKPASGKAAVNITKEIHLDIQELLRGTTLEVRVNDPANPQGPESYELIVPPETAPGTRFRLPRTAPFERGVVLVRVKARPDFRFRARGSDLRCDLRISARRALQGGVEKVRGATGNSLRVQIPKQTARGEILRIAREGLPKPRGGRGDLLVRVLYTHDVQIRRASRR
ncbi:MAG: J domain-containing protein [Verrucomicrobiae bacterium]|nr:J domain-containing protein [Verrucomicrobiae bacterium]